MKAILIDEFGVFEYHDEDDGRGKPSQVHIVIDLTDVKLCLRLKSRRAAVELIAALRKHTDNVWPADN